MPTYDPVVAAFEAVAWSYIGRHRYDCECGGACLTRTPEFATYRKAQIRDRLERGPVRRRLP